MTITSDEYATICEYVMNCAAGKTSHTNTIRLDVCRWIIEKVADGTITVEG